MNEPFIAFLNTGALHFIIGYDQHAIIAFYAPMIYTALYVMF
jgi:hypothetical protein